MSERQPDALDIIRQNSNVKEYSRMINKLKAGLNTVGSKLSRFDNLELKLKENDTRTAIEKLDRDTVTLISSAVNGAGADSQLSDYIDLEENASPGTPTAGTVGRLYAEDVAGFTTVDWLWTDGTNTYDLDLLRDSITIVKNETGAQLDKGTVVNIVGSTGNFPTVAKLDAKTNNDDDAAAGLVYQDIGDNNFGIILTQGDLENFNTSMFQAGDFVYVDPTTPGALTDTRPSSRDRVYPVGEVVKANVAGIIEVKIKKFVDNDFRSLHYSTFLEQHTLAITSNGTVITATLDNKQGDDYLQAFFSNGKTILNSGSGTLPLTVDTTGTLTAGTDTVPQLNYIYILASAPTTLVASTSGWPGTEHIRVATVNLISAATTQTDGGAFSNQEWNDEPSYEGTEVRGHIAHIGENLRARGANWNSGVAGAGSTSGYITITDPGTGDEVYFETGSGKVFQLHEQTWDVFDSATDDIFVKNDNTTAYNRINDLRAGITEDSTGTTIPNNRYFSLVFWGVVNADSTTNWVGVNLPSGVYQSANAARVDRDKHDDFSIPDQFRGVGFLICRITFQKTSTTWVVQSTDDLRGNRPQIAQGSFGASQQTEFLDSNFRVQDNSDPSKEIALEASGITTNTTRTITMPDADVDLDSVRRYYLGVHDLFFQDSAGSHTFNRNSAFANAILTVDGSGIYSFISAIMKIPENISTDTLDVVIYYGYNDSNDTAFNFRMWMNSYDAISSATAAPTYNILSSSQGTSVGIGTTNLNIRSYTRSISDANINGGNNMLAFLIQVENFTASAKISIYGVEVIFNQ